MKTHFVVQNNIIYAHFASRPPPILQKLAVWKVVKNNNTWNPLITPKKRVTLNTPLFDAVGDKNASLILQLYVIKDSILKGSVVGWRANSTNALSYCGMRLKGAFQKGTVRVELGLYVI